MTKIVQRVDTSTSDRAYVRKFEEAVLMLVGLTIEGMETTPQILLSHMFRKAICDKAKEVEAYMFKLRYKLVADNPGEDFK